MNEYKPLKDVISHYYKTYRELWFISTMSVAEKYGKLDNSCGVCGQRIAPRKQIYGILFRSAYCSEKCWMQA